MFHGLSICLISGHSSNTIDLDKDRRQRQMRPNGRTCRPVIAEPFTVALVHGSKVLLDVLEIDATADETIFRGTRLSEGGLDIGQSLAALGRHIATGQFSRPGLEADCTHGDPGTERYCPGGLPGSSVVRRGRAGS